MGGGGSLWLDSKIRNMKVERGNNRGGKDLNGDRGIEKCLKLCGGSIKTKEIRKKVI